MNSQSTHDALGAHGGTSPILVREGALGAIVRLSVPTVVSLTLHSALLAEEAALLGRLNATLLAGAALVFPWLTMIAMMSSAAVGGGVSSAIARAMGAGRRVEVLELAGHAMLLAGAMGTVTAVILGIWHGAIFSRQGGTGEVLEAASLYGSITLAGGVFIWAYNIAASIFRGLGNTLIPAKCAAIVSLITACVIPPVVLGWEPIPSFGLAGAGVVMVLYYLALTLVLLWQLLRHGLGPGGGRKPWAFSWRHIREILHVGGPSAFNTVLSAGVAILATTVATRMGRDALAAYGAASRIEFLLMPIVFGIGSALVPLVGMNVGAGQWDQVRKLAWTGAALGMAVSGFVGLLMWLFPLETMRLFTNEAPAIAAGVKYFRWAAWGYGFWGLGLGMTFSSQGARRPITSLVSGFARCLYIAMGGFWMLSHPGYGTGALGFLMGSSAVVFAVTAIAIAGPLLPNWMRTGHRQAEPCLGPRSPAP